MTLLKKGQAGMEVRMLGGWEVETLGGEAVRRQNGKNRDRKSEVGRA